MYLVTFGMCMRALLFTQTFALKDRRDIRWAMVVVALLMFIFSTFDGTCLFPVLPCLFAVRHTSP